jgi:hypothetical protein
MNQIAEVFRNPRLGRGFFRDSIQRACHLDVMNQIPILEFGWVKLLVEPSERDLSPKQRSASRIMASRR